ncbi:hypothetical protein SAMN05421858_4836 [Haladaptatus litoreus]|uniref:Uncharacterized protein n=1 Tax=Haladaptatus litoreus TaxID=553468 RepID=A0A1N7F987_9EURY|nr:hypothetical protein SAMN05421858_4836 [Haladaptatus litoreus]
MLSITQPPYNNFPCWPFELVNYNVVIEGDRVSDPLHFAEIDAENDTLHRNQPIATTMFHRQCGVNLGWWCRPSGGSTNHREYNAIISVLRFLPRLLRVLASPPAKSGWANVISMW